MFVLLQCYSDSWIFLSIASTYVHLVEHSVISKLRLKKAPYSPRNTEHIQLLVLKYLLYILWDFSNLCKSSIFWLLKTFYFDTDCVCKWKCRKPIPQNKFSPEISKRCRSLHHLSLSITWKNKSQKKKKSIDWSAGWTAEDRRWQTM